MRANFPCAPRLVHTDTEGRVIVLDFEAPFPFRVINIYAPNSGLDKIPFFDTIFKWVNDNTFVIGDFNTPLTKMDYGPNNVHRNDTSRPALFRHINNLGLADIWRGLNTNCRGFSRRQLVNGVLKQSRIDLCLASTKLVKHCDGARYEWGAFSDHSRLTINVKTGKVKRNGGYWCLNNSLLEDEIYVKKVSCELERTSVELDFIDCSIEWWESVKVRLKKMSINYAKQKSWRRSHEEESLKEQLQTVLECAGTAPPELIEPLIVELRTKLNNLEIIKCKGAMAKEVTEGERSTAYFLSLEKRRQNKVYIGSLKDSEGKVVSETEKLLKVVEQFYVNLFSSAHCTEPSMEAALA